VLKKILKMPFSLHMAFGMRRTRYRGLQKTHFHHLATAMALNLQRFVDWIWDISRAKTRQSHFARLELAA
jgi:transposase